MDDHSFLPTEAPPNEGVSHHAVFRSTPSKWFCKLRRKQLTPIIRVDLNESVVFPSSLPNQHSPDTEHLKGASNVVVNWLCGPPLVLSIGRVFVGSSSEKSWRPLGPMAGAQVVELLQLKQRYNFMLADSPARLIIARLGEGKTGGLYAKHALLSEFQDVAFAGEMWLDEDDKEPRGVHFDNTSGTYKPSAALLPVVRDFLAHALQIKVHAHTREGEEPTSE